MIGVPTMVIELAGSTSLVQAGNNYFMDNISSGTGPELKLNGVAVVAGQFGGWIQSVRSRRRLGTRSHGKFPALINIWSGRLTANIVAGTNSALEALETSFHQDLNGDGVIGVPSGNSVAALAVFTAAAGSSANDSLAFLPAAGESRVAGNASAPGTGQFSNPANGNHLAAFWSDLGSGHTEVLFQMAIGGHSRNRRGGQS